MAGIRAIRTAEKTYEYRIFKPDIPYADKTAGYLFLSLSTGCGENEKKRHRYLEGEA